MGLFGFLGGLVGSGSAKKASRKAQAAQIAAYEKGIGEQRRQFDLTRADYAPYLDAGRSALGAQGNLVGLNGGDAQQSAIDSLRASPLYQSIFRTGEEAVLQNASATGGLRGGNTQRGLADFGADTLSNVIQQQLAQLGGLSGMGVGATGAVSGFGQNSTNAITSLLAGQGDARASGLLFRGGLNMQNWKNAGSFLDEAVQRAMMMSGAPGTPGKMF